MSQLVRPPQLPHLVVSDVQGNMLPHPGLRACGRSGGDIIELKPDDFIPLPPGSELFALPSRLAIGFDADKGDLVPVEEGPGGEEVWPAAAFMAPAHTALYLPAYASPDKDAPKLPLFAYAALGWLDGQYWVSGVRVDTDPRQDPPLFDYPAIEKTVQARLKANAGANRLLDHLGNCALVNRCAAAQNFFQGRFEAPLPSSPQCNADCVGCLSFQPKEAGFPSTQNRIQFIPTAEEIADLAAPHLEMSEVPVASFGQGCEGDALMNPALVKAAIQAIRARTKRGVINLNTNGSKPEAVRELVAAGLDSIRVSMNSAQDKWYTAYYRPRGYGFADVKQSLAEAVKGGAKASINYFVFPGVSDREREVEALLDLISDTGLHLIQWRNLNLDPDIYMETLGDVLGAGEAIGVAAMLEEVKRQHPGVRWGYYNPAWGFEDELPLWVERSAEAAKRSASFSGTTKGC